MQRTSLSEKFEGIWEESTASGGAIPEGDVKGILDIMGYKIPNHEVRDLLNDLRSQNKLGSNGTVPKNTLLEICQDLDEKQKETTKTWKTGELKDDHIKVAAGQGGGYHVILDEEQVSFANWINRHMKKYESCQHLLPLKEDGSNLYEKVGDGIIFCELINKAVPDTIDPRAINYAKNGKVSIFKQHENLTLAVQSARSIGCTTINMDSHSLSEGRKHLILGLTWQILARFLLDGITLQNHPGLIALLRDGETIEDFLKLSPEQILMRWVNYQLEKAGCDRRVSNLQDDITDSVVYGNLIKQIAPEGSGVNKLALQKEDLTERAEGTLQQADKIDCRDFVSPTDVVKGHKNLNLAFVANLFNKYPALEEVEGVVIEETREEKMYRNWMNSLGVDPHVNYLYGDLADGLVIFQLYDFIQPGIVDWNRVVGHKDKSKHMYSSMDAKKSVQVLCNCNYAVELGKKMNFVLVGIDGNDIREGNKMLTLALVWQLMRAYTLSLLAKLSPDGSPIVESEIISWANERLKGKDVSIRHFKDKAIKNAVPVLHLIDVLKPGSIDYGTVKTGSYVSNEECMSNAKYAITMARRIGAPVYALPEDLVEMKHKMVMTVFASLMYFDMNPN